MNLLGPQLRELFGPGTPGLHPVLNVCSELRQHIWRAIHPHMHPSGQPGSHSSIRPSMHLFTHPPLHSSTQLPTQPQSFMQLSAHSPIRPLIPASIHPSSTHSSVRPPLHPSIRAFTQTSIHRSINASIHPKAWPQFTIGLGGMREAITITPKIQNKSPKKKAPNRFISTNFDAWSSNLASERPGTLFFLFLPGFYLTSF